MSLNPNLQKVFESGHALDVFAKTGVHFNATPVGAPQNAPIHLIGARAKIGDAATTAPQHCLLMAASQRLTTMAGCSLSFNMSRPKLSMLFTAR